MKLGRVRFSVKKPRLTPLKPKINVSKREVVAALARLHNMSEEELKRRIEEVKREAEASAPLRRGRLKYYTVYDEERAKMVIYAITKAMSGTVTTIDISRKFGCSRNFAREKIITPLRKMGVIAEVRG